MDNQIIIEESNMRFGKFDKDNVFHIEKSNLYTSIIRPSNEKGGKICEFNLYDNSKLYFIEAKQSSPNPQNKNNNDKFKEYIEDIVKKLHNSLQLFLSAKLNILKDNEDILTRLDINKINECSFIFLLVINGHNVEWLTPLKDELEKQLFLISRIWNINVLVLNDEQAKRRNLLTD